MLLLNENGFGLFLVADKVGPTMTVLRQDIYQNIQV